MARSINDLAAKHDMTPRAVRKHIRAFVKANGGAVGTDTPGKGKRYSLDARAFAQYDKMLARKATQQESADSE